MAAEANPECDGGKGGVHREGRGKVGAEDRTSPSPPPPQLVLGSWVAKHSGYTVLRA